MKNILEHNLYFLLATLYSFEKDIYIWMTIIYSAVITLIKLKIKSVTLTS